MDVIHQKLLLFIAIFLQIVDNILKEIVAWSGIKPPIAAAIITIAIFAITVCVIFFTSLFLLCYTTVTCNTFWSWLLQVLAVLAYYIGDDLPYILRKYSDPLKCDASCQTKGSYIAIGLLAFCMLIQFNITHQQHNRYETKPLGPKDRRPWWTYALNIATVFFTTDIIYSIIATFAPVLDYSLYFTFSVLAVCVIIGWFRIITNFQYSLQSSGQTQIHKNCNVWLPFISCGLFISLPLHLLSDNEQPLGLIFSCQPSTANAIVQQERNIYTYEECSNSTDHALRFIFQMISAVTLLLTSLMFLCRYCKEKRYYDHDELGDAEKIS